MYSREKTLNFHFEKFCALMYVIEDIGKASLERLEGTCKPEYWRGILWKTQWWKSQSAEKSKIEKHYGQIMQPFAKRDYTLMLKGHGALGARSSRPSLHAGVPGREFGEENGKVFKNFCKWRKMSIFRKLSINCANWEFLWGKKFEIIGKVHDLG